MPATRPAPEALLSEQMGWAIYTMPTNGVPSQTEANMLVHLTCNVHFPNWSLSPSICGVPAQASGIHCRECDEDLPFEAFKVFYGAYRLLNMRHA
jgi:hypothetical protein